MQTECKAEARYLLEHAIRTRGLVLRIEGDTFKVETPVGRFALTFFQGNRRILISHGVEISEESRGKGYGRIWLREREAIAKEAGINLLLATVRDDNKTEIHLLDTEGWFQINQRETGVSLWGKEL